MNKLTIIRKAISFVDYIASTKARLKDAYTAALYETQHASRRKYQQALYDHAEAEQAAEEFVREYLGRVDAARKAHGAVCIAVQAEVCRLAEES